jgi:hypothetical protein
MTRKLYVENPSKVGRGLVSEIVELFAGHSALQPLIAEQVTLEQIEQEHIRRVLALAPTLENAAATLGICIATCGVSANDITSIELSILSV